MPENLRDQVVALIEYARQRTPCVFCGVPITISATPGEVAFWVWNAVWTVTQGRVEVVPLCYGCLTKLKLQQLDTDELAVKLSRQKGSWN